MTLFEYIVCASLLAIAFVKVYDWIEYQIALREEANRESGE